MKPITHQPLVLPSPATISEQFFAHFWRIRLSQNSTQLHKTCPAVSQMHIRAIALHNQLKTQKAHGEFFFSLLNSKFLAKMFCKHFRRLPKLGALLQ